MNPTSHATNPLRMLLVLVFFLAAAAFVAILIASRDPAWFVKGFTETPARVVVYHNGQADTYEPGDDGYQQLAAAVQSSLDQGVARSSGIGLSPESLQDAYEKSLSVEAFFPAPVKLHAPFNTYRPTQMLFLLTGRHSDVPIVFMGVSKRYMSNGPVLKTRAPLLYALQELGYDLVQVD